ncbi:MAG: HYR domain-containing protein, partial [Chitinophagales bacterium]|nr:HYR domain-containing protein [Chitinophagales bacterium]
TVTDACGNASTAVQVINVDDTEAPVITGTIASTTVEGCDASAAPAAATDVAGLEALGLSISDACTSDANLTVTHSDASTGTCPLVITRTYTVTDACGNASTAVQVINVNDTEAPTFTSCPTTTTKNTDPGVCTYQVVGTEFDAVATDDCSTPTMSYVLTGATNGSGTSSLAGVVFAKGITTVQWTATDACGNSISNCSFTVTVQDKEKPVITCPANITVAAPDGACNTLVTITPPTATDNCGLVTILTPQRYDGQSISDPFPVGTTQILWTAVDGSFNDAACIQTVTVTGNIVVTIQCPPTVTRNNDAGKCEATISTSAIGNPTVLTGCNVAGFTRERSDGKTLSAPYPVGTTIITWKAVNGFGDVLKTCTQSVIVVDNEKPVITLPAVAASYDA